MISGLFSLPLTRLTEAPEATPRAENAAAPANREELFFAGPENILVRSLANAALAEALPYNPLVLCGASGVGKSALAQSLAVQRAGRWGLKSVVLTTGADFARVFANAIDSDSVADLRSRQQRCDLLLIDDLHRLATKPAAQQYLLSIFDALIRRGTLIVVTLRRSPQTTRGLMPGLASRLMSGLVVPLAPPGVLARRELAQRLAAQFAVPLSDEALLRLTGDESPVSPTAPRLRHAIMQLASASAVHHRPVRASQISQLLAAETPEIKTVIKQVTAVVARHSQLSVGELKSKSRQQSIADARGLAMFIARRLTQASYAEIGRHFGNRDHSTVLHSCRKFDRQTKRDEDCRRQVEELIAQIAAGESG